ncbi:MAG: hypothetical protein ACOC1K_07215, partial [Nanoarchaeota archaeon]
ILTNHLFFYYYLNKYGFYNNWKEDYYTLDSINDYLHIADSVDNYFTPNLFKGFTNKFRKIKRNDNSLMWLTSLYIDIDGIDGVYNAREAKKVLFNAFDEANIDKPNFIIHTSTNPTIRVQLYWLLDPMYLKENNDSIMIDRISWWRDSARSMIHKLKEVEPRLKIDEGPSTNSKGYFRLPGSINQKTGETVKVIYKNISDKRYTLEDNWLTYIRKEYYEYLRNTIKKTSEGNKYTSGKSVLEHEQIKMLLDNGVPKNYRNKAVYALTKACYADGLSFKETVNVIEKFNDKCKPSNAFGELLYWIKASYGLVGCEQAGLKNIDPYKVKNLVNEVFGTDFKADMSLYHALRRQIYRNKKGIGQIRGTYMSKEETINKVTAVISSYVLSGDSKLPNQKELALIAGVKYNSMTKKDYWNKIKELLYTRFGIVIKVVGQSNELLLHTLDVFLYQLNIRFIETICLLCKIPYNKKSIVALLLLILLRDGF